MYKLDELRRRSKSTTADLDEQQPQEHLAPLRGGRPKEPLGDRLVKLLREKLTEAEGQPAESDRPFADG
jgi:hypothetical protein